MILCFYYKYNKLQKNNLCRYLQSYFRFNKFNRDEGENDPV